MCSNDAGNDAVLQLCATLNLLPSGGYQVNVGRSSLLGMAHTTVSTFFKNTIVLLENEFCPNWINLDEHKFSNTQKYFYDKFRIPGVVGSHVPILKPTHDEHMFFNRKGFHSLNAMLICNHKNEIVAVNSSYGGAAHDSFVWSLSAEQNYFKTQFQEGNTSIRIIGDSGYPLQPWLLTPYKNAVESSPEINFNNIHAKARNIIERTIGTLKGRWRCLSSDRKLRYSPELVSRIINVCCALHNACIYFNVSLDAPYDEATDNEVYQQQDGEEVMADANMQRRAQIIRNNIRDSLI